MQIVNEMASAAGLPCDIDPALCAALRSQKTGHCCTPFSNILVVSVIFSGLFAFEHVRERQ